MAEQEGEEKVKKYYFAYGSNMKLKCLQEWCKIKEYQINLKNPFPTELIDYEPIFNKRSTKWDWAMNIVKSQTGDSVWGVLFETDEDFIEKLDEKEKGYVRIEVEVLNSEGELVKATTYIAKAEDRQKPNKKYIDIIIEGANEQGLPKEYITDYLMPYAK